MYNTDDFGSMNNQLWSGLHEEEGLEVFVIHDVLEPMQPFGDLGEDFLLNGFQYIFHFGEGKTPYMDKTGFLHGKTRQECLGWRKLGASLR